MGRNAYWIPGAVIAASLLLGIGIALLPQKAGAFWPFSVTKASDDTTAAIIHDSSINLLAAAINSDPNSIQVGDEITTTEGSALIAHAGPEGTIADITTHTGSGKISTYTVRAGDSLSSIASMFDVSANTILWANNLTSKSTLTPGMTLVILPISGLQHTVQKGETIVSLAKAYGSDADEIRAYNGLDTDATLLAAGTKIIIPGGELAAAPAAAKKTAIVAKKGAGTSPIRTGGGNGSILPTGNISNRASDSFVNPVPSARRTQGLHGWNAVDLAAPLGTSIHAASGGTVIVSRVGGWNGGYGNYIVIDHGNGIQTLYSHLSVDQVSIGQTVTQGEVIGQVGRTGEATGYHLHFEVRGARNPFGY